MNILKEQNDNLSMQLVVHVEEADYQNRVKKELNKLRDKAQLSGFRKGHVPAGLIQKMYGQAVLVEEINKILQESVGKFLEDEKIDLLGAPFPAEDTPVIDFDTDKQFNFKLNVLLTPNVNLDFLKDYSATYYKIVSTEAFIDEQVTALRERAGSMEDCREAAKERDYLHCDYQSMSDENLTSTSFFFIDEKVNPWSVSFIGHKVGDTLELDIDKLFKDAPEKASQLLNLDEEDKDKAKGLFKFTITEVKRRKEAELNEELFKQAFPDRAIKTEKELRENIAEVHGTACGETVDIWFFNTNFDPIIEKANLHYNDKMLRQYIAHQNATKNEAHHHEAGESCEHCEVSDEQYESIKRATSWQLLQQKMMDTYQIKVGVDEVRQAAKEQISRYFGIAPQHAEAQLGDYMGNLIDNIMKDKDQVNDLYSRALDKKLVQVLKENVQLETKEITWDEFLDIVEPKKEGEEEPKKTKKTTSATKKEAEEKPESAPKPKKTTPSKKTKKEDPEQPSLFE